MAIVVRFAPDTLTAEQYDESIRKLDELGLLQTDGLEYHVCFGTDPNLMVSEIWTSQEQWEAFGEKLMPILAEIGIEPGEPTVFPAHNTISN